MGLPNRKCMADCPPWGYCATEVTAEQFMDGVCGSKNGIHGYDGYVTQKEIDQRLRAHGMGHLVDRQKELAAQDAAASEEQEQGA